MKEEKEKNGRKADGRNIDLPWNLFSIVPGEYPFFPNSFIDIQKVSVLC
jgi:hypothetical protein